MCSKYENATKFIMSAKAVKHSVVMTYSYEDNSDKVTWKTIDKYSLLTFWALLLMIFFFNSYPNNNNNTSQNNLGYSDTIFLPNKNLQLKSVDVCSKINKKYLVKYPMALEDEYQNYLGVMFRNSSLIRLNSPAIHSALKYEKSAV